MRFFYILLAFAAESARATNIENIYICDATDRLDRDSSFKVNLDTQIMEKSQPSASPQDELIWGTLYSESTSCGHESNPKRCEKNLWHNVNDPSAQIKMATYSARCTSGQRPMPELNGNLEINRDADGSGFFVCGPLSKHDLLLSNCRLEQIENP